MDSIPRFIESKHHPEKITYLCPQLEPILSVTYGCIVYQEQVIEIFRKLGGYSLGQADNMRRAISKKEGKDHPCRAEGVRLWRRGARHPRRDRQRRQRGRRAGDL